MYPCFFIVLANMFTLPPPEAPPPVLELPYTGHMLSLPFDEITPVFNNSFAYNVKSPPVP